MAKSWATSGSDLHLDLGGRRGRAALEYALREAVQTGQLPAGTRLPSSRVLAHDLGIARNTVVDAYGQLVAEGWLTAVTGSGTRVAERVAEPARPGPAVPRSRAPRYDLRPGHPDPSAFPRTAWATAARRALVAAPVTALGYGDPRGRPELRQALAGYLARARGVRADPEHIVICAGFTGALSLLCQVLAGRSGAAMAVEAYGHASHRRLIRDRGLRVRQVPVDGYGAVVERFGTVPAALLTPAHQFPLGVALSAARRTRAVRWADADGALLIEDDYDGEFRYDRQSIGAMQALAPQRVVYAGTASKTLAPGLRLGWLVVPAHLLDDVVDAKSPADRDASVLDQLTLAEFIASGRYDRHVRRCRLHYRRRRDRLVTLLRERAPQVRVTGLAAGLHAVLDLPAGTAEEQVVERAAAHGLALDGLGAFGPTDPDRPALVIGYGTPPAPAFTSAIARLATALTDVSAR